MCDDKNGSCGAGGCGGQHHGCGHKSLVWWLIALAIGVIVFCAGYKLGVLRGYMGGWGYYQGGYPAMMNGWGYGMMRGWSGTVPASQTAVTSSVQK